MIAALYVERAGTYWNLPDVDPWDVTRDARLYAGPWPVVAHPPCNTWCKMAPVNQARWGLKIGDDGGCFEAALAAVRRWGGVLEHPAVSIAWRTFGLPKPFGVGWQRVFCGGFVAQVEQGAYGHRARKKTWLYGYGIDPESLRWGAGPEPTAWISSDRPRAELAARGIAQLQGEGVPRNAASKFRDLLLSIARTADPAPQRMEPVR